MKRVNISKLLGLSFIMFCMICVIGNSDLSAQENKKATDKIESDSKREEVQRYFGYETLLYRYLSLPYDTSLNTNEHGGFVEIGYLYILFIPLLLLFLARRKWKYFMGVLIASLALWIISTSNAFLFSMQKSKITASVDNINQYLDEVAFSSEPIAHLVAYLYKISLSLFAPFEAIGNMVSGEKDGFTYAFLFLIFILGSLLVNLVVKGMTDAHRYLVVLFWIYGFYWLAFAGGIIWYGYILLVLGYFLILILLDALKRDDKKIFGWFKMAFFGLSVIWICTGYVNRISNVQSVANSSELGKGIFNPVFYEYGLGKINQSQAINKVYPNATAGLNRINEVEDGLILRIGTSFTYFIDNNTQRVHMDNQLGLFYELYKRYPDQSELVDVMKASNIKFIIVDLHTPQIDKTPNKTLTEKYNKLMEFIFNNPRLRILATDRVLKRTNNSNKLEYFYGMFGEIQSYGQYAMFEIL